MMRVLGCISALVLLAASGPVPAQGVSVRSGEHPAFSRLVFAFPTVPDWTLERAEGGYRLSATPDFSGVDLSDLFRLIPRTRLSDLSAGNAADELFLEMPCDCRPNAFILNGNTLVIDIYDAPARDTFETSDEREPPTSDASVISAMIQAPLRRLSSLAADSDPELPLYPTDQPQTLPTPVLPLLPEDSPEDAQAQGLVLDLATELSRAAAQGLISARTDAADAEPSPELPAPPPDLANIRIDNAIDRAFGTPADEPTASDRPETCLSNRLFDVANWGDDRPVVSQMAMARSDLVGEFDKARPDKIVALARLYIHLSFGIEARDVILALGEDIPNLDLLLDLAELVETAGPADTPLRSQIACDGPGALWAAVAVEDLPRDRPIAIGAILRTFNGLPPHLRRHIGPGLAAKFGAIGAEDAVASIDQSVARVAAPRDPALVLTRAFGAADSDGLPQEIVDVAQSLHPQAADALERLINDTISRNEDVPEKLWQTALIMAFEKAGTELGGRLHAAAIRALLSNGAFRLALDEYLLAMSEGSLSDALKASLRTAILTETAQSAPDDVLALIAFDADLEPLVGASDRTVQLYVGNRLIDIGFADRATLLAPPQSRPSDEAEIRYAIRLARVKGDLARTKMLIDIAALPDLRQEFARTLSQAGRHAEASQEFSGLGDLENSRSEAWRSGDWEKIAEQGDPEIVGLASRMVSGQTPARLVDQPSLADLEARLSASAELQAEIETLFARFPNP